MEINKLNLEEPSYYSLPMKDPIHYWNRICELVSLARTIDPNIPNLIRGYKETDIKDPLSNGFELYLTNNNREEFSNITEQDLPLIDTLKKVLPDYIIEKELLSINKSSALNFNSPIESIIYNAYKELALDIKSKNIYFENEYDNYKCVYTSAITIPSYYYQNNRNLKNESYFIEGDNKNRERDYRILNNKRESIKIIKELIQKPLSNLTENDKKLFINSFNSLNNIRYEEKFEDEHNFSIMALSLNYHKSKEANEWIDFLYNEVGCSVTAKYGFDDIDLLSLAIVRNNKKLLNILIDNDLPIMTNYEELPNIFTSNQMYSFKGLNDSYFPSIVLASLFQADKVIDVLLDNNVAVNAETANKRTAAHYAAINSDAKIMSILIKNNINLDKEDYYKLIPAEIIPNTEKGDILYKYMEDIRLNNIKEEKKNPSIQEKKALIEKLNKNKDKVKKSILKMS